jgi:hypothetical protein
MSAFAVALAIATIGAPWGPVTRRVRETPAAAPRRKSEFLRMDGEPSRCWWCPVLDQSHASHFGPADREQFISGIIDAASFVTSTGTRTRSALRRVPSHCGLAAIPSTNIPAAPRRQNRNSCSCPICNRSETQYSKDGANAIFGSTVAWNPSIRTGSGRALFRD